MSFSHAIGRVTAVVLALFMTSCARPQASEMSHRSAQPTKWPEAGIIPPDLAKALDSGPDLWGEAALQQPGGPSYEFFEPLLAPMRYVDAPFRHYPITLSAPGAAVKARFISNGSAINALARQRNWIGETGTPVTIRVGRDQGLFGEDLSRLDGPKYEQDYLPIVQLAYRYGPQTFKQEAFAPVAPELSRSGVVLARFTVASGPKDDKGKIEAQIEGYTVHKVADGVVRDDKGLVVACFEPDKWRYTPARGTLIAELPPGESAVLSIYTQPAEKPHAITAAEYDAQRTQCIDAWNDLLARGTRITVPEKIVNDAYRATIIGNFMLLSDDQMRYSHGNQYAKIYIAEGGDATRTMGLQNYTDTARACIPPLFVFTRKGLEFHQAALKLQMLAHYYHLTQDAEFVRSIRQISAEGRKPGWQTELDLLLNGREAKTGLFPPEQYAGDIEDKVYSLNSNSNGWRGLRDMSVVLEAIGETALAEQARTSAERFRAAVLDAIEKSIVRGVDPPFIPLALFGAEKPYQRITEQRLGSYWNIMTKYVLTSGVFPINHEYADALVHYAQRRGGLMMGMNRNRTIGNTFWVHTHGINDLYTMRYALALLERDDPDRALVSFYGKLAHGFTRDTFIDGEGASAVAVYGDGRQTYLPPNSAGNANFQQQLRYLLVQDYDHVGDDGKPDTLRLLFATPRKWLADGKMITVERAPTMFGELSMTVKSQLKAGRVTVHIKLPERARAKTLLRLRLPDGAKLRSAQVGGKPLNVEGETIDLSGLSGAVTVEARVK